MSAFLGPIHYWLYNKIQLQQNIVDDICQLGDQYGLSLKTECEERYGSSPNKPLEEMIDHGNIHGWLQEQVSLVEYKYAYSVTSLLNKNPEIITELTSILSSKGKALGSSLKEQQPSAKSLYQVISDNLLDGMPCDHANRLLEQNENEFVWKRELCVHEDYWNAVGGDIAVYYELRDAWLKGLSEGADFEFHKLDPSTYSIKK